MGGVLLAFAVQAAEPATSAAATFVPARAIEREEPQYPLGARIKAREGWVRMSFCIDTEGAVKDPIMTGSSGAGAFEQEVTRVLSNWKYAPATQDGRPVEQCLNGVLVKFALHPVGLGARGKFVSQWKRIGTLIENERLDEAADALARLEPWNNYEYAHRMIRRAQLAAARGDPVGETMCLESALNFGEYLEAQTYLSARHRHFHLLAERGQFAAALSAYETLATGYPDTISEGERLTGEKLRAAVGSASIIATPVRLPADVQGPDVGVFTSVSLLRRSFGFVDVEGQVDRFELRCESKWYSAPVSTEQIWHVPQSWGRCALFVFGMRGASMRLREYPNSDAQSSSPAPDAPAASTAATAD